MPVLLPLLLAAILPSDYAGAEACRKCHAAEYQAQSASAHARALGKSKSPQPGEWAFGAGEQAITFVTRVDPEHYLEEGKSWYRRLNGYARTPGAHSDAGTRYRLFDPAAGIIRCFACHSTGPVTMDAAEAIVPHETGVRCEVCHGPAAAHVRDPVGVRPPNPGKLGAAGLNDFCGSCHRMAMGAAATPDLRDPWNARHQPLLLAASRCFRESQGRLSCLTCHSPHAPLETRLAAYDATCSGCHAAAKHQHPVAGKPCAGCHMPAVTPQTHLVFANHRIGVYSPADPLSLVNNR